MKCILIFLFVIPAWGFSSMLGEKNIELINYFQGQERKPNAMPFKNTYTRIMDHGYPAEEHTVFTDDGYVIKVFRIPFSHKSEKKIRSSKPSVLLQHGLYGSSDSWVILGPNDGLPFLLADAGFDVWLGNSRGTIYGLNHTKLNSTMSQFWNFSWHEIGESDVAAIVDYISAKRTVERQEASRIHYVGFSQGTTALMVLLSMRPEYNAKFKSIQLLAPMAFTTNTNDKFVKVFSPLMQPDKPYVVAVSSKEFVPNNKLFSMLKYNVCRTITENAGLCSAIACLVDGDFDGVNKTAMHFISETHPAGCSTNQLLHYMQEHMSKRFCQFDHGLQDNLIKYGVPEPPDYNMRWISSELNLWYGNHDEMSTVPDVELLAALLPNSRLHLVNHPNWSHGDFLLNTKLKKHVNQPIVDAFTDYEQRRTQN